MALSDKYFRLVTGESEPDFNRLPEIILALLVASAVERHPLMQ